MSSRTMKNTTRRNVPWQSASTPSTMDALHALAEAGAEDEGQTPAADYTAQRQTLTRLLLRDAAA